MKQAAKFLPVVLTVAATLGAAIFTPSFVAAHPTTFIIFNVASQILHATLPSVFGGPQNPNPPVQ